MNAPRCAIGECSKPPVMVALLSTALVYLCREHRPRESHVAPRVEIRPRPGWMEAK